MMKLLKILAATAAVASVVPVRNKITENSGSLEALLWKASWTVDPDYQSEPNVNITVGFNNIFRKADKDAELFAEEVVVDEDESVFYADPCAEDADDSCEADCVAHEETTPVVEPPVAPVAPAVETPVVAPVEKCDCCHCNTATENNEE